MLVEPVHNLNLEGKITQLAPRDLFCFHDESDAFFLNFGRDLIQKDAQDRFLNSRIERSVGLDPDTKQVSFRIRRHRWSNVLIAARRPEPNDVVKYF